MRVGINVKIEIFNFYYKGLLENDWYKFVCVEFISVYIFILVILSLKCSYFFLFGSEVIIFI